MNTLEYMEMNGKTKHKKRTVNKQIKNTLLTNTHLPLITCTIALVPSAVVGIQE